MGDASFPVCFRSEMVSCLIWIRAERKGHRGVVKMGCGIVQYIGKHSVSNGLKIDEIQLNRGLRVWPLPLTIRGSANQW